MSSEKKHNNFAFIACKSPLLVCNRGERDELWRYGAISLVVQPNGYMRIGNKTAALEFLPSGDLRLTGRNIYLN